MRRSLFDRTFVGPPIELGGIASKNAGCTVFQGGLRLGTSCLARLDAVDGGQCQEKMQTEPARTIILQRMRNR